MLVPGMWAERSQADIGGEHANTQRLQPREWNPATFCEETVLTTAALCSFVLKTKICHVFHACVVDRVLETFPKDEIS